MTNTNMRRESAEINLSRRAILSGGAVACLATAAVAAPVAIMQAAHPDGELLATFDRWLTAARKTTHGSSGMGDEAFEALLDEMDGIGREIAVMTATTVEGMAIHQYLSLHAYLGSTRDDGADVDLSTGDRPLLLEDLLHRAMYEQARRLIPTLRLPA